MISRKSHPWRRHAFTLIELLVVIGILAILIAFLVPMITKAMKQGSRTKTAADMQAISAALEEFKNATGDYPRPEANPATNLPTTNVGFALLGRYLVGPFGDGVLPAPPNPPGTNDTEDPFVYNAGADYMIGMCVQNGGARFVAIANSKAQPTTDVNSWAPFPVNDGADGPGYRLRAGSRVVGPFLQDGKFKMHGMALLDRDDNPILYFPAAAGHPNVNLPGGYLKQPIGLQAKYDPGDGLLFFRRAGETDDTKSINRFSVMLGDDSDGSNTNVLTALVMPNGGVDAKTQESAAASGPFLLWSAGPDGLFGPLKLEPTVKAMRDAVLKCDDVANFR